MTNPEIKFEAGDLMTLCHLKHLCRTTMAANGGSMGRSTSTTPNTQGEFILLIDSKRCAFSGCSFISFLKKVPCITKQSCHMLFQ